MVPPLPCLRAASLKSVSVEWLTAYRPQTNRRRRVAEAMTLETHEYFEERHQLPSSAPASDAVDEEEGPDGSYDGSTAAAEKIALRLRTGPGNSRPQTVRVFPDATIESVIAAFLNKTGRAGMQGVRLQIDGEDLEMDSTVADADLEDGDLVEVAGIE